MPPSPSSSEPSSSTGRRRRSRQDDAGQNTRPAAANAGGETSADEADGLDIAAELTFLEAQTALELSLAELQSPDLDVEAMTGLYRRARRYADRCEELLQQVEQEVMQWDAERPEQPPQPYRP